MTRPLVVFRCDASPALGGGHVARCLGFAQGFAEAGHDVAFVVSHETPDCAPALRRSGFPLVAADADTRDPAAQLEGAFAAGIALLVVDHYRLGIDWERACRRAARRILVIDDLHEAPHDCDALVNSNAGAREADYAGLVPEGCRLFLGPRFAPLAPGFAALREASLARRESGMRVERILVSFGLTDPGDATSMALAALQPLAAPAIDVALGAGAPHLARVRDACAEGTTLHVDSARMPELMAAADLALGAAGATSWERACLGLPSIVLTIADNQRAIAEALAASGAAAVLGDAGSCTPAILRAATDRLMQDDAQRRHMARAAAAMCDGRGAARIAAAMSR